MEPALDKATSARGLFRQPSRVAKMGLQQCLPAHVHLGGLSLDGYAATYSVPAAYCCGASPCPLLFGIGEPLFCAPVKVT